MICNDVVIVGSSILDFPAEEPMPPGDVRGFDVRSGRLLWTFHTVPLEGEAGADSWDDGSLASGGGVNVLGADELRRRARLCLSAGRHRQ